MEFMEVGDQLTKKQRKSVELLAGVGPHRAVVKFDCATKIHRITVLFRDLPNEGQMTIELKDKEKNVASLRFRPDLAETVCFDIDTICWSTGAGGELSLAYDNVGNTLESVEIYFEEYK